MPAFNKVILAGNLTRDPEIRYTTNGKAVTRFSIAINSRSKQKDFVEYVNLVAWNELAEVANNYLRKGAAVLVEGELRTSSYEKNGERRYATDVVIRTLQFLSPKPADAPERAAAEENDELEEEVPF